MDTILQAFLSWQFLFFCIGIAAVVFVIRKVVEYWMANWWPLKEWAAANKDNKLWRDLILPVMPIILGQLAGFFFKQYPYPEGFSSGSGRFVFGLVAGFSSGFVVKLYLAFLSSKVSEFASKITNNNAQTNQIVTEIKPTDEEKLEESVRDSINKDQ